MTVQTRGEFGGLGIEVTMEDGLVKVVSPIDETPASKAGILANDLIIQLDDENVQGLTLNQAVEKMRGPVNTKIKLKVIRKGQDKPLEITLTRENIKRPPGACAHRAGRHRLHPRHLVQRADDRGPEARNQQSADPARRQAEGLHRRPAQQPRRLAGGSGDRLRRVPRARRNRLHARPQHRRDPAPQRQVRRPDQGQADHGADQRRLGLGLGNRRGRPAGPQARNR